MSDQVHFVAADPAVVEELMEALTATFEAFAAQMEGRTPAGLTYLDGLMGCHNFYKRIILDLEERSGGSKMVRLTALNTLALALFPGGEESVAIRSQESGVRSQ